MPLKSKNPMDDLVSWSPKIKTHTSPERKMERSPAENIIDEEIVEKRVRQLMSKKNRTLQRSLRIDRNLADWLNNVKDYQREVEGIPRPCLDDIMYDAITEYLRNHYSEMEP